MNARSVLKAPVRKFITILYSTEPSRIITCNGILGNSLGERVYCNTMFAFRHEKYKVTIDSIARKCCRICDYERR